MEAYIRQRVVVVGHSASGVDISSEISKVSQLPVFISEKTPGAAKPDSQNAIVKVGQIISFEAVGRTVTFSCGRSEKDIDHVVFATGYMYSYPFLQKLAPLPPVYFSGARVENTYLHMIYHPSPTLFFTGLPQRIVPFPISEVQSAVIARLLSGRLPFPDSESMVSWEQQRMTESEDEHTFHNMKFPQDVDYLNYFHDWALSAQHNFLLDEEGVGKVPPRWGEEERWLRGIMPHVKEASRQLGARRHEVRTLAELGFHFEAPIVGSVLGEKSLL